MKMSCCSQHRGRSYNNFCPEQLRLPHTDAHWKF